MACINRLFLVKGIFFYFNMLYSRLTCIPNTGRSLNSDAAFYENVALVGMKPITDVSVKLFSDFLWINLTQATRRQTPVISLP